MASKHSTPTLDDLPRARVIVVGDVIRDIWITGTVDRISPEAPVPVFLETSRIERPGGAANVSANLTALGLNHYKNVLLGSGGWAPPIKYRYTVGNQQIFRHDDEEIVPLSGLAEGDILRQVGSFKGAGCLILSDYGKGTLTPSLCASLIEWAQSYNIPVVVDPKGDDWSKYRGATVITPNEAESGIGGDWPKTTILVTRGAKGMQLWPVGASMIDIPAQAKDVFDVTGAGDTVVAALGAGLAVGFDMESAARIANAAAGVVVGKRGTATCSLDELRDACVWLSTPFTAPDPVIVMPDVPDDVPVNGDATFPGLLLTGEVEKKWIAKVREIIASKPKVRDVAHWEKGWQENLTAFRRSYSVEDLRPKYIRDLNPVRWRGRFWMPDDPDYEWSWYGKFFDEIAQKWLHDAPSICEFGSGSGHNLARLSRLFPNKTILGLDWSDAAVRIADFIPGAVFGRKFDLLHPGNDMPIYGDIVLTVGAMEQTGRLWRPFLNYLLAQRPMRVVHIEPILNWYDPANPIDATAIEAHKARGFWEGYTDALASLVDEGKIEIEHRERTGFGSLLIEGYSQLIWRPL